MSKKDFKQRLPGYIAAGLIILMTCIWTFWGASEMYYEGWGLPFPQILRYLSIGALCLAFSLITLSRPRIGGLLLIIFGSAYAVLWTVNASSRRLLSLKWFLGTILPLSSFFILVGTFFLLESRFQRQRSAERWMPSNRWSRHNIRYLLAVGLPLLVAIAVSIYYIPFLNSRVDDGNRGSALIEGNGVTLIWAPEGPGWNWKQPWGGFPSWDQLALYGVPPIGFGVKSGYENRHATAENMKDTCICRYLSEDGTTLMRKPQNIWRMPTTEEIVRSLVSKGQNAGCTWDKQSRKADCVQPPNKDTPLWAPDEEPIYYWSADEYNVESAWYVPYTGGNQYGGVISQRPKDWGNPRHGYRCVRDLSDEISTEKKITKSIFNQGRRQRRGSQKRTEKE